MMFPVEHCRFCVKHAGRWIAVFVSLVLTTGCTLSMRSSPPPEPVVVVDPSMCDPDWMARQQRLVRDLTAPYGTRRYIRADGSVCEPPSVAEALAIHRAAHPAPVAVADPIVVTRVVVAQPARSGQQAMVRVVETVTVQDLDSDPVTMDNRSTAIGDGDGDDSAWFSVFTVRAADGGQLPSVWNPGVMDL